MLQVVDLPADEGIRRMVAGWLLREWSHMFPDDTVQWYLDVWADADASGDRPPHAVVAMDGDEIVGTASVVADDELPGAPEPGPWLALTYVLPAHRRKGAGRAMVLELMRRCPAGLWLYTESEARWYGSMGWKRVRDSSVNGVPVTVMTWSAAG